MWVGRLVGRCRYMYVGRQVSRWIDREVLGR